MDKCPQCSSTCRTTTYGAGYRTVCDRCRVAISDVFTTPAQAVAGHDRECAKIRRSQLAAMPKSEVMEFARSLIEDARRREDLCFLSRYDDGGRAVSALSKQYEEVLKIYDAYAGKMASRLIEEVRRNESLGDAALEALEGWRSELEKPAKPIW